MNALWIGDWWVLILGTPNAFRKKVRRVIDVVN
jgi:hypothetical protein